jgi:hypothetical protein
VILMGTPFPWATTGDIADGTSFIEGAKSFAAEMGVTFWDFGLLRYEKFARDENHFNDVSHMAPEGAEIFSRVFSDILNEHEAGTLNISDYLYSDYTDLHASTGFVYNTWIAESSEAEGSYVLESVAGTDVEVEYELWVRPNSLAGQRPYYLVLPASYAEDRKAEFGVMPEGYIKMREYGTGRFLSPDLAALGLPPGDYTIRVNARPVGSNEAYQQFSVMDYSF